MHDALSIVGDWGTSHMRLFLCAGTQVIDQLSGPGIAPLRAAGIDVAGAYHRAVEPWFALHGPMPALLCGTVGANIGWAQIPYIDCPADVAAITSGVMRVADGPAPVAIIPGIATINALGAPDIMRGEETQIIGAMALHPMLAQGDYHLCLPGTHSKWVTLSAGRMTAFHSAMTGELFAALAQHSILLDQSPADPLCNDAFLAGVARIKAVGGDQLLSLLFETRTRQLRSGMSGAQATGFLSGLLIGAEIAATRRKDQPLVLIGSPRLTQLYTLAAGTHGISCTMIDGDVAVLAGLHAMRDGGA